MKNQPTNDAIETALSGAEIYVRDVKVTSIKELEEALKKLEVDEDEKISGYVDC